MNKGVRGSGCIPHELIVKIMNGGLCFYFFLFTLFYFYFSFSFIF